MTTLFCNRKTIDGVEKLKNISKSTILILQEAEKQGIEWKKIKYTELFRLTYKGEHKYFHYQIPSETTAFASYCCRNKRIARNILEESGISVAKGYLIKSSDKKDYKLGLFKNLQKPLVVKPVDQMQGANVIINITSQEQYMNSIRDIYAFYGQTKVDLLVEEMFEGDEYRILATQDKVLSIIKRIAPNVVGDGKSTISRLIELKNQNLIRQKVATYHDIVIDETVTNYLLEQGYTLESVLDDSQKVFLRPHSPMDISLGGDTVDVTDTVHPSVHATTLKIMKNFPGLALGGIDFMTKNIFAEQTSDKYRVIEVNSSPSLDWNQYPLEGKERNITFEFLKIMFPNLGE